MSELDFRPLVNTVLAQRMNDTARFEKLAIDAVTKFGLRTDADFTKLKILVDRFYWQQVSINQALRDLEREASEQQ